MGNKLDIDSYAEFQAKNGLDETNELVASIFELLIKVP